MTTLLKVQDLNKIFHGEENPPVNAVHNISLNIEQGSSLAIIGASGSGKSTLLHMLGLLEAPSSGEIEISQQKVSRLSEKQKATLRNQKIGFIFQDFNLLPHLTVLENVMLPFLFCKKASKDAEKMALAAIDKVGLNHRVNFPTKLLSGGEKQRTAIARAIVLKPEIILADEPTGNLDSTTGIHIMDLLFQLQKEEGITLIIVTHDLSLAKKAQSTICIHDGQIIKNS